MATEKCKMAIRVVINLLQKLTYFTFSQSNWPGQLTDVLNRKNMLSLIFFQSSIFKINEKLIICKRYIFRPAQNC